jgi:hypothetical protein
MDRSKFALPRWTNNRAPKDSTVDSIRRPVLELSAVIAHGYGTYLYITHENTSIGSNWTSEVVLRTLDFVWGCCQRKGEPMPCDFFLHGDNTTSQLKNSITGRLLAMLVAKKYFRAAGHQHLRVGHSHEDVGATIRSAITNNYRGQTVISSDA